MSKTKLFFLAVVVSIPIQLGKYFFFDHSFVLGIPIDYRAVTLYLSDFFILAFICAFFSKFGDFRKLLKTNKQIVLSLLAFNLYLIFSNAIFSVEKMQSLFSALKTFEFSLLFLAAASYLQNTKNQKTALIALWLSVFFESAVLIFEFISQRSLGLRILGERSFDISTSGIAHFTFFGQEFLRPYGTFPHPNVAGAFLAISLIVLLSPQIKTGLQRASLVIIASAAILTFSKSALAVMALFAIAKSPSKKFLFITLCLTVLAFTIFFRNLPAVDLSTFAERLVLSQAALDISLKNPAFGIGSGNFILELSKLNLFSIANIRLLQPVHNIFLLILTENGTLGLLLFALFLYFVSQKVQGKTKIAIFLSILVFSSIDHYFLTLHQGQTIFFLALAYLISPYYSKPSKLKAN